jgi:hypothetical protein
MAGKKAKRKKLQRKAEEHKDKVQQVHKHLAYVHDQAALAQENNRVDESIKKQQRRRIKMLNNRLKKENKFLPADSQLGICTLSSGITETLTENQCHGTPGWKSWTPL